MKVVVDCAGGTSSLVLPSLLGRVGRGRAHRQQPPGRRLAHRDARRAPPRPAAPRRSSSAPPRAAFGVRFDPVGERIALVDEMGQLISEERALLVVLDLVAAERRRRPGGAAGHHHPGRRAGLPLPRRAGASGPPPRSTRSTSAAAGDGHDLRGRRAGRLRRARVRPDGRRHGGVHAAARPGGPHPAVAQPDRRQDPRGQAAQAHGADPVGGQGRGHALGHRGAPSDATASTPPTACGWSPTTAAGRWCCPTRPSAVTHLWAEGPTWTPRRPCWSGGPGWSRRPPRDPRNPHQTAQRVTLVPTVCGGRARSMSNGAAAWTLRQCAAVTLSPSEPAVQRPP